MHAALKVYVFTHKSPDRHKQEPKGKLRKCNLTGNARDRLPGSTAPRFGGLRSGALPRALRLRTPKLRPRLRARRQTCAGGWGARDAGCACALIASASRPVLAAGAADEHGLGAEFLVSPACRGAPRDWQVGLEQTFPWLPESELVSPSRHQAPIGTL